MLSTPAYLYSISLYVTAVEGGQAYWMRGLRVSLARRYLVGGPVVHSGCNLDVEHYFREKLARRASLYKFDGRERTGRRGTEVVAYT